MKINLPTRYNEFEVQAELYALLKQVCTGTPFVVRGEVLGEETPKGRSRCDLVVFRQDAAIAIIEVKDTKPKSLCKGTRQYRKYQYYKIPVLYCFGMDDITPTLNTVRGLM